MDRREAVTGGGGAGVAVSSSWAPGRWQPPAKSAKANEIEGSKCQSSIESRQGRRGRRISEDCRW
jgi:hypothetical protein